MSIEKPIRMVVRRGALKRFNALKDQTAHLPVEVSWDRRQGHDRRAAAGDIARERRGTERRQQPSFTWELADFVVIEPNQT